MFDLSPKQAGPSSINDGSVPPIKRHNAGHRRIDFSVINDAALAVLPDILARWLSDARIEGQEYVARNPKRQDDTLGSFKINMRTGKWSDFSTGDRGGDPTSLAAYLFNLSQGEAAKYVAAMLGVPDHEYRK